MDIPEDQLPSAGKYNDSQPNTKNEKRHGKDKIYCEDDLSLAIETNNYHLRCDLTAQTFTKPVLPFSYSTFSEYVRIKFEMERLNRQYNAMTGTANPDVAYFTDKRLKREIFDIYGEMDEENQRFHAIFQNYKEQRIEQLHQWIEEENEIVRRKLKNCLPQERVKFVNKEEVLQGRFSKEEIALFQNVSGCGDEEMELEPFLLPRPKSNDLNKDSKSNNDNTSKKPNKRNKKSQFLRIKDGETIFAEMQNIVSNHPLGLTKKKLLEILEVKLLAKNCVHISLSSEMLENPFFQKVIFMSDFQNTSLVFPVQLKPVLSSSLTTILWQLKHKFLAILNLHEGIIEVNRLVHVCFVLFKINRFKFTDWGFQDGLEFVRWLFHKWQTPNNVEVIEVKFDATAAKHYLAVMTNERRQILMAKKSVPEKPLPLQQKSTRNPAFQSLPPVNNYNKTSKSKKESHDLTNKNTRASTLSPSSPAASTSPWTRKPEVPQTPKPSTLNYNPNEPSIPAQFVQLGQTVYREQMEMKTGTQTECIVTVTKSPTSFYVVQLKRWEDLQRLCDDLRDYWSNLMSPLSPHSKFLQKNYICLAKRTQEEATFQRVVIINCSPTYVYGVFSIDFGEYFTIEHNQLRYLPSRFLGGLDAQSIACKIYNVASPKKDQRGDDLWDTSVCAYTQRELSQGSRVKVLFKQREQTSNKWLVKVSTRTSQNLGEDIMKFVNKGKTTSS